MPSCHTLTEAYQLLQLSTLITTNIHHVISAWASEPTTSSTTLPSPALHKAQCTLVAAMGKLTELIAEPSVRILELGCQYWESRALYIAVERRVADLLAEHADGNGNEYGKGGLSADELGTAIVNEGRKLERIMRCLCSSGVFMEIEGEKHVNESREVKFANNGVSRALVGDEGLRAYVLLL